MDRMSRANPGDDIISKGPILIGGEPPKGYTGIRTTIQIRDLRSRHITEGDEFVLDAVINTEIRKGHHASRQRELQDRVTGQHHELAGLLLQAIKDAQGSAEVEQPKLVVPGNG